MICCKLQGSSLPHHDVRSPKVLSTDLLYQIHDDDDDDGDGHLAH
jgi:hypothetical protein